MNTTGYILSVYYNGGESITLAFSENSEELEIKAKELITRNNEKKKRFEETKLLRDAYMILFENEMVSVRNSIEIFNSNKWIWSDTIKKFHEKNPIPEELKEFIKFCGDSREGYFLYSINQKELNIEFCVSNVLGFQGY